MGYGAGRRFTARTVHIAVHPLARIFDVRLSTPTTTGSLDSFDADYVPKTKPLAKVVYSQKRYLAKSITHVVCYN